MCEHTGAPALHGELCLELDAGTSGGKRLWEAQLFCGLNSEVACTKERCLGGHTLQQLSWSSSLLLSAVHGPGYLVLPPSLYSVWSGPWQSSPSQQKNNPAERKEGEAQVLGCFSQLMGHQPQICSGHRGGLPVTSLRHITSWLLPNSSNSLDFSREWCLAHHL